VEYQSSQRHYAHVDCPWHADYLKNMITGRGADGRSDSGGVGGGWADAADARAHFVGAPRWACRTSWVFMNKADMVDDKELAGAWWKMEVRELLSVYKFPGDETPIVIGSALKALEGDKSEIGVPAGGEDWWRRWTGTFRSPKREVEKPFLMPVEDVFSISGPWHGGGRGALSAGSSR